MAQSRSPMRKIRHLLRLSAADLSKRQSMSRSSFEDGTVVCADAKCKIETTEFSERTMHSLHRARTQFPVDKFAILILRLGLIEAFVWKAKLDRGKKYCDWGLSNCRCSGIRADIGLVAILKLQYPSIASPFRDSPLLKPLVPMNSARPDGGYDDGYKSCPCFWGGSPGSLIKSFLEGRPSCEGLTVLDLGCGEGKNAAAFASAGALVDAVDCSIQGIANGRQAFPHPRINWIVADVIDYLRGTRVYDIVIMYGLLHCLPSQREIAETIDLAIHKTTGGGSHFVVAFNDGPHDLSAHPGLQPTLLSHKFYLAQYAGHQILDAGSAIIHESHPHNNIPHFHSITRLTASIVR
jgi:tellurite methyltransferase